MEGILEKPSRIPGKKTKVWSVLDETTLSFFQENKRSSCIGSVDLSDILSVHIIQECQFEIVTDVQSHIYTAVSQQQCKEWVEKLLKFSKSHTEVGQSTSKKTPVFLDKHRSIDGKHSVQVKAAKNIFEANAPKIGAPEKTAPSTNHKVPVEPTATRKSDPTKVQPWSTIEDARSHLNHVDKRNSCVKTEQGSHVGTLKMDNLSSNCDEDRSRDIDKRAADQTLSQWSNECRSKQDNIEQPTKAKLDSLNPKNDFKTTLGFNINNKTVLEQKSANKELLKSEVNKDSTKNMSIHIKDCSRSQNTDHSGIPQNNSEFQSKEAEKQRISKAPQNVEPGYENRPDSGYSTTVGETSRNSHENKIEDDVFQTSSLDLEAMLVVTKPQEPSKSSKEANNLAEAESEEVSQIPVNEHVVTMRKSGSCVSVDQDDVVTVIPDVDPLTFPNTRRSKKSLSRFDNKEIEASNGLPAENSFENTKMNENQNKPQFFTLNEEPVRSSTRGSDGIVNEKSCVISQDHVDGEAISVNTAHAVAENCLDIDKIISNTSFPNIPALPNTIPNKSDLVSFHELKNTLNNANSSGECSDVDEVPDYDPIERLSRLVES